MIIIAILPMLAIGGTLWWAIYNGHDKLALAMFAAIIALGIAANAERQARCSAGDDATCAALEQEEFEDEYSN